MVTCHAEREGCRLFDREPIRPCRDRRERHAAASLAGSYGKGMFVKLPQEPMRLVGLPLVVDRADRVNHPAGLEPAGPGQPYFAGRTPSSRLVLGQAHAFFQQAWPSSAMDRPIDPAAAGQRGVRGVDNRIDGLRNDVALHKLDAAVFSVEDVIHRIRGRASRRKLDVVATAYTSGLRLNARRLLIALGFYKNSGRAGTHKAKRSMKSRHRSNSLAPICTAVGRDLRLFVLDFW